MVENGLKSNNEKWEETLKPVVSDNEQEREKLVCKNGPEELPIQKKKRDYSKAVYITSITVNTGAENGTNVIATLNPICSQCTLSPFSLRPENIRKPCVFMSFHRG